MPYWMLRIMGFLVKRLRNFFFITIGDTFDVSKIQKAKERFTVKDAISELYQFEGGANEHRNCASLQKTHIKSICEVPVILLAITIFIIQR